MRRNDQQIHFRYRHLRYRVVFNSVGSNQAVTLVLVLGLLRFEIG